MKIAMAPLISKLCRAVIFEIWRWVDFSIRYMPGRVGEIIRSELIRKRCKGASRRLYIAIGVIITGYGNIRLGGLISIRHRSTLTAHNGGYIEIGNNCSINSNVHIGAADNGKIVIGDNVLIGPNVVLRASNHRYASIELPIISQGHDGGYIIIENDVWICANSVITSNVKIGTHSIIGAGSVVTHDVEPYSIVGGVPAVLISKR